MYNIFCSERDLQDKLFLEDFVKLQADLSDLDEFPSDSEWSNQLEQEQIENSPYSPSSPTSVNSLTQYSPVSTASERSISPYSQVREYTIPKSAVPTETFISQAHRLNICTKHHSILCNICSPKKLKVEHRQQSPVAHPSISPPAPAPTPFAHADHGKSTTGFEKSPTAELGSSTRERKSTTVQAVLTELIGDHKPQDCPYLSIPRCTSCGNCICCLVDFSPINKTAGHLESTRDALLQPLILDIPDTVHNSLNTSNTPLSNNSLHTPHISPVSPVTLALFNPRSPATGDSLVSSPKVVSLLDLDIKPTPNFLKPNGSSHRGIVKKRKRNGRNRSATQWSCWTKR